MVKLSFFNNKKAQDSGIGMSFGFIFSIILIIFFVFAAIWGIKYFISLNNCSRIGLSLDQLQKEVQTAYQSSAYSREISLDFPGLTKICFANISATLTGDLKIYDEINIYEFKEANTFLIPGSKSCGIPYKNIKFLNLTRIISNKNPYCIDTKGKFEIKYDPSSSGRGVVIQ